jgi:hypothetical protein
VRILWSILLCLVFLPNYDGDPMLPLYGSDVTLWAEPVQLDPAHPEVHTVERLTFLGGIALKSHDPAFGGFSSLLVLDDRFTLLSDGGNVTRFRMGPDFVPRDVHFSALPDGPGPGWDKVDRDSESMTRDPATGAIWAGFETYNQIWRYNAALDRAEAHARPPAMADWPVNEGPESMVRLRSGQFLVIAETQPRPHQPGTRVALMFAGDPTKAPQRGWRFSYVPPKGFDPSDATELPNGDIMVLNRRFQLPFVFSNVVTIMPRAAIRPDAIVRGIPVATLAPPLIHDNFEGVAITREKGATIVWLVSDDNQQTLLQRTYLLKFRLEPEPRVAAPRQRNFRPQPSASSRSRASGGAP